MAERDLPQFRPTDFSTALQESGMSPEAFANSQGVFGIADFLRYWLADPHKVEAGGYSLGLGSRCDLYAGVSHLSHLTTFDKVYEQQREHFSIYDVEPFLEYIVATESPIVFFVPPHVLGDHDPGKDFTKREMQWFLADQRRMKNVYFVFGLYDLMTTEEYLPFKFATSYERRGPKIAEALRNHIS